MRASNVSGHPYGDSHMARRKEHPMLIGGYSYPVAISKLGPDGGSREPQNVRAIKWLLAQDGGPVVEVTPRKDFEGAL